jgi:Tlde1 domain
VPGCAGMASIGHDGDGGLLVRLGVGSIAAALAAFATGFIPNMWLTLDSGPADAGSRADASDHFVSGSIHPKAGNLDTAAVGADMRGSSRMQLASLNTQDDFAFTAPDDQSEPSARSPFGARFAFDLASVPSRFARPSQTAQSFDDRFSGEVFATGTAVRSAAAAPPAPAPRAAARSVVAQIAPNQAAPKQAAPKRSPDARFQLASADTSLPLGYAPTDQVKGSAMGTSLKGLTPKDADPLGDTSRTAIYDITARTVYLPNGRRLEAHSGLGEHMDDLRYVNVRMKGPTPPNVYQLKMRESLFHGVRAIRLIPTDDSKMYGRAGILAHSYLLGPSGQSNGCVSFSNYAEFLDAYQRGEINRLVVVERLAEAPSPKTASDWLKDIFRGS